jgi:hypothetical protein
MRRSACARCLEQYAGAHHIYLLRIPGIARTVDDGVHAGDRFAQPAARYEISCDDLDILDKARGCAVAEHTRVMLRAR